MRVTVEADRESVTYCCVHCRARLTLPSVSAGNAGVAFVETHRHCEPAPLSTAALGQHFSSQR